MDYFLDTNEGAKGDPPKDQELSLWSSRTIGTATAKARSGCCLCSQAAVVVAVCNDQGSKKCGLCHGVSR